MITVWWPAAGLIHYSFLNPDKIITSEKYAQQINEMHRKLQRRQPVLSTERAKFFSTTTPYSKLHNQKLKELG